MAPMFRAVAPQKTTTMEFIKTCSYLKFYHGKYKTCWFECQVLYYCRLVLYYWLLEEILCWFCVGLFRNSQFKNQFYFLWKDVQNFTDIFQQQQKILKWGIKNNNHWPYYRSLRVLIDPFLLEILISFYQGADCDCYCLQPVNEEFRKWEAKEEVE